MRYTYHHPYRRTRWNGRGSRRGVLNVPRAPIAVVLGRRIGLGSRFWGEVNGVPRVIGAGGVGNISL